MLAPSFHEQPATISVSPWQSVWFTRKSLCYLRTVVVQLHFSNTLRLLDRHSNPKKEDVKQLPYFPQAVIKPICLTHMQASRSAACHSIYVRGISLTTSINFNWKCRM